MLTQSTVRKIFDYNPTTGELIKKARLSRTPIRSPQVVVDGVYYRTSTIIWLWMTGEAPEYILRINPSNHDNRWVNFRLPTVMDRPKPVMGKYGRKKMTKAEKMQLQRQRQQAYKEQHENATPELDALIGTLLRTPPI